MVRLLAALSLLASALPAPAAPPAPIREAATRALALIQSSQQQWDDGWACASCHHQYLPAIAFQSARAHGFRVDEKIAHADAEMAFRGLSSLDAALHSGRPLDVPLADSYRLWAAESAGVANTLAIQADVRLMAHRQYADGHWASMDQRPPQSNSPFTATALAIHVL